MYYKYVYFFRRYKCYWLNVTCCHSNGRMGLQGQCHFFLFSSKLKARKIFCDEMASQYLCNICEVGLLLKCIYPFVTLGKLNNNLGVLY